MYIHIYIYIQYVYLNIEVSGLKEKTTSVLASLGVFQNRQKGIGFLSNLEGQQGNALGEDIQLG